MVKLTYNNFLSYLSKLEKEKRERFIDLLFDKDFNLNEYIDD